MIGAFAYLILTTTRNRLTGKLRRLRNPRYALAREQIAAKERHPVRIQRPEQRPGFSDAAGDNRKPAGGAR